MVLIGFWESSEAESISNDKGIYFICFLLIGVYPFEVSYEFWVQLIDRGVEGSKLCALGQKIYQVEIDEGG